MNAAEVLERVLDGDDIPPEQMTDEVARGTRLALVLSAHVTAPAVTLRTAARTELRDRLLTAAALRRTTRPSFGSRWRERLHRDVEGWAYSARIAGVSGVAAILLSGGGVAVATDASLPGDPLHGLKLAVEDVRLALTEEGLPHAMSVLERAEARVAEAEQAVRAGRMDAAAHALDAAAATAREGAAEHVAIHAAEGDDAVLVGLSAWSAQLRERVAQMDEVVGAAWMARADLLAAIDEIRQRVGDLIGCEGCAPGVDTPPIPSDAGDAPEIAPTPLPSGGSDGADELRTPQPFVRPSAGGTPGGEASGGGASDGTSEGGDATGSVNPGGGLLQPRPPAQDDPAPSAPDLGSPPPLLPSPLPTIPAGGLSDPQLPAPGAPDDDASDPATSETEVPVRPESGLWAPDLFEPLLPLPGGSPEPSEPLLPLPGSSVVVPSEPLVP